MRLLQRDAELKDIVQLVGEDALPDSEKLVLDIGRMIKEDFLRQSAFDPVDAYSSMKKQHLMLDTILDFRKKTRSALEAGVRTRQPHEHKGQGEDLAYEGGRARRT